MRRMLARGKVNTMLYLRFIRSLLVAVAMFMAGAAAVSGADPNLHSGSLPKSLSSTDSSDYYSARMIERYRELNLSMSSEQVLTFASSTLWAGTIDLAKRDNALYALNDNGLQVFDVSDIADPQLTASIYLGYGDGRNMMRLGEDHLFLARYDELHVFDVSVPLEPQHVSVRHLEGRIADMELIGDRLYLGIHSLPWEYEDYPSFYVLDVSDPLQMETIGKYESPSTHKDCVSFAIGEDYIYAANSTDLRIEIISVADEKNPVWVKSILYSSPPYDVMLHEDHLYVVSDGKILKYQLTDPVSPSLVDTYNASPVSSIQTRDTLLYIRDSRGLRICVFDGPGKLDTLSTYLFRWARRVVVTSDYLLLVPEGTHGFTILDASDPTSLEPLCSYSHNIYDIRGLAVKGDYAYVGNIYNVAYGEDRIGLYVVDVSDREAPELVRKEATGDVLYEDVYVHDTLLISFGYPRSCIYSIADPAQPELLSQYTHEFSQQTLNCRIVDTLMYLVSCGEWLEVLSIADPVNPVPVGSAKPDGELICARNVSFSGGTVYVLGIEAFYSGFATAGLYTYDISDLEAPLQIDHLPLAEGMLEDMWGMQITRRGNSLYLTTGESGLTILDVSDSRRPDIIANFAPEGEIIKGLGLRRNYAFVTGWSGIYVLDISSAANPELVQVVPLPGNPYEISIDDEWLYVTTASGFHIFHLELPDVLCGDIDWSGGVDIDDIVALIEYVFQGGTPPDPVEAGDVDCSGGVDIDDIVYLIAYVFQGGAEPCAGC